MKTFAFKHTILRGLAVLAFTATLTTSALAQSLTTFKALPSSKMKIDGTSTIHDWTIEGNIIGGSFEIDSTFPVEPAAAAPKPGKVNAKGNVVIPVRSLKSEKTSMDAVMQQAMKYDQFPKIEYKLTELTFTGMDEATKALKFDSKGDLTVAGVTKPAAFPISMERVAGGKLKFSGTTKVKMTDHGVTPPAPKIALGMIKTGDEVTLTFEWNLSKPAPAN